MSPLTQALVAEQQQFKAQAAGVASRIAAAKQQVEELQSKEALHLQSTKALVDKLQVTFGDDFERALAGAADWRAACLRICVQVTSV